MMMSSGTQFTTSRHCDCEVHCNSEESSNVQMKLAWNEFHHSINHPTKLFARWHQFSKCTIVYCLSEPIINKTNRSIQSSTFIYIYMWYRLVLNHKKAQLHPSYCCTLSVRRPSPAVTFARLNARKGVAPRVDALYLSGVGATGRIGYIGINISLFFYALEMYLGLSMATVFFWVSRYIISL